MSAGDDDASGRRRKAAASASDGLHGSADGLVSDNDIHLFDLMADDLLDLAAGGDDADLLGGSSHNARNGSASGSDGPHVDGIGTSSAAKNTATTNTTKNKDNKRRSGTGSKKKKAAAATSSAPTESFEYITTDQINKHDVLCGRGAGIVKNPGNEHFRTLVVARKDEYNAAERNSVKNAIAGGGAAGPIPQAGHQGPGGQVGLYGGQGRRKCMGTGRREDDGGAGHAESAGEGCQVR